MAFLVDPAPGLRIQALHAIGCSPLFPHSTAHAARTAESHSRHSCRNHAPYASHRARGCYLHHRRGSWVQTPTPLMADNTPESVPLVTVTGLDDAPYDALANPPPAYAVDRQDDSRYLEPVMHFRTQEAPYTSLLHCAKRAGMCSSAAGSSSRC
ncbi:hypothetical protein C8R44DRAFT_852690 [Mycena epipterygia]|nr:hypothetical protein C8R44DRAFT_852690 [Mycena epipterygia]